MALLVTELCYHDSYHVDNTTRSLKSYDQTEEGRLTSWEL